MYVTSVTIQWNPGPFHQILAPFCWNPVESGRMDAFLQESVGHQKVQMNSLIKQHLGAITIYK